MAESNKNNDDARSMIQLAKELEERQRRASHEREADTEEDRKLRAEIRRLYVAAAELGDVEAQAKAAVCYAYCIGGPRDFEEHRKWVEKSAAAGSALALGMRAENLWFGENQYKLDPEVAAEDAKRSMEGGSWIGATVYSWYLRRDPKNAENVAKADEVVAKTFPILKQEAETGDAIAEDWLAWRYCNGEGVTKDVEEGVKWFRKSAVQGLAWAQLWLGLRYETGDGVPVDLDLAKHWIGKAAAQGLSEAQSNLDRLRAL